MMPSGKSTMCCSGTPFVSVVAPIASIFAPVMRTAPFSIGAPSTGTTRRPLTIQDPDSWAARDAVTKARMRAAKVDLTSVALQVEGLPALPDPRDLGRGIERRSPAGQQGRQAVGLDRARLVREAG